ncbi:hypothetical protein, partial [Amphibacillus sediminis]|uniref:hypothetical protein n=1 Tax=Amphibacillus sediminis TaxID=360185 RepID=UPI001C3F2DB5
YCKPPPSRNNEYCIAFGWVQNPKRIKLNPSVTAADFQQELIERSSKKSGHKYAKVHLKKGKVRIS